MCRHKSQFNLHSAQQLSHYSNAMTSQGQGSHRGGLVMMENPTTYPVLCQFTPGWVQKRQRLSNGTTFRAVSGGPA